MPGRYVCRGYVAAAIADALVKAGLAAAALLYVVYLFRGPGEAWVLGLVLAPAIIVYAAYAAAVARTTRYEGGRRGLGRPSPIAFLLGRAAGRKVYMYGGVPVICELEVVEDKRSREIRGRREKTLPPPRIR